MIKLKSSFCFAVIVSACALFVFGTAPAASDNMFLTQLTETIAKVRTGETAKIRTEAAEHLFELTRGTHHKIDDKTLADLASLLDGPDDSVRYWVARCLGNFGRRARTAAPKLQEVLAAVDCLQGSKTSASGIRFALTQMGVTPAPPACGTARK